MLCAVPQNVATFTSLSHHLMHPLFRRVDMFVMGQVKRGEISGSETMKRLIIPVQRDLKVWFEQTGLLTLGERVNGLVTVGQRG